MEYEKLTDIISQVLNINPEDITPGSSFVNDFGADSLDLFQLVLKIEEEFGLEISSEAADSIVTVEDLEKLLRRQE